MMHAKPLLGWVALAALLRPFSTPGAPAHDPRRDQVVEAVERALPSIVNIRTERVVERHDPYEQLLREFWGPFYRRRGPEKTVSLGSGVIIDEDGWVITNFHVVARASSVFIKLADGREFEADRTIVATSFTDIALLRIRAPKGTKFKSIALAADDDLLLGETVLALGNPFGLGGSVSRGILSSKSRRPPTEHEPLEVEDWLQTDAAINPGNSGGPLINVRGELIGLNVAVYREGQGIGFAIPVKRVTEALAEIYTPEIYSEDGQPTVWFGARVKPGTQPLLVISVEPESPAGKAGLHAGDRILEVNGRVPRSFIAFSTELIQMRDDRDVVLTIQRQQERRTIRVRMVKERTFFNPELVRKKLGITVQDLTPSLAQALGLPSVKGVVISEVDRFSPADRGGLRQDMIITGVDGQVTETYVMLAKVLHLRKKGDKVRLELMFPRQRGPFIEIQKASAEVLVR